MVLIWAGPNGEDVYQNLQLSPSQQYDLDAVFEAFKRYCEPICNFCAARFKFRAVKQHKTETINTFYHCILHPARQCQFENITEHLIDAIVYRCTSCCRCPFRWCLKNVCWYVDIMNLQWHINTVRLTGEFKAMDGLTRQCPRPKSRSSSNTRRS